MASKRGGLCVELVCVFSLSFGVWCSLAGGVGAGTRWQQQEECGGQLSQVDGGGVGQQDNMQASCGAGSQAGWAWAEGSSLVIIKSKQLLGGSGSGSQLMPPGIYNVL